MDQHCSEGLGIVGLETFDHELDGGVVLGYISIWLPRAAYMGAYHVSDTKVGHIKDNSLYESACNTTLNRFTKALTAVSTGGASNNRAVSIV